LMTAHLLEDFATLTVVDAAAELLAAIPEHPRLRKVQGLFEDYRPDGRFDGIVMEHVLEHVADPGALLARVRGWMRPAARLVVGVPNAWSFHRLAAVHMGLLARPTDLNERDRELGHRRVYTPDTLRAEVEAGGFAVVHEGGVFLKPLSNAQIDAHWSEEMLEGFYRLGLDFPRHAAEIFVVCE
jgi:2-polyprenyl-3-methyl-5-hydroxy-6-metoxy-1,4-benzoquinol methylase